MSCPIFLPRVVTGQCWSVEKQTKRRQRVLVRERIWSLNCWKSCKCDDTNDKSVFWWLARRTKDSRFLSVKCWGRREGKYSQWRGRTTQCQLDSLFYISIWASTKIQNTFTKIQNTLRKRSKGKYSQWRERTTQCPLDWDWLFYISIWATLDWGRNLTMYDRNCITWLKII